MNRIYYTPQSEIYSVGAVAYYFLRDDKNGEDDSADCFGDHEQYDVLNFDSQYEQSIPSGVANAIRKGDNGRPVQTISIDGRIHGRLERRKNQI